MENTEDRIYSKSEMVYGRPEANHQIFIEARWFCNLMTNRRAAKKPIIKFSLRLYGSVI
uniref:Uncharacterized protein n=1 Tax=Arion vulgaris TaxID=1028688 RepID=A0A0B7ABC1_9EUPU